ncbi:MAG TPA: NAD(P)/FAD-dependent oxidoreductase [Candidatus Methylomirabilis sp.]|nr:NAD(P)/FAD-dependent oxidoreductase [Candidatus Methylomirabilis sp.]
MRETVYDVIVVGAGPGGSSAATFLAQRGLSVLLLDKADFPRDKVCGDGLTPQALVWLDVLGCLDEVLAQADSCVTSFDLFINGEHVLTTGFPRDTPYPAFGTCLQRSKLDHILVKNAVSHGAVLKTSHLVRKLIWLKNGIAAEAESTKTKRTVRFNGRLLIGADGANSIVSRSLGNVLRDGTVTVSLRAYYQDVTVDLSPVKFFFSERFFPGYGWLFVDDRGKGNAGFAYVADQNFPMKRSLKKMLCDFVGSDLKEMLRGAAPMGSPAGWWTCFSKPKAIVADRVMLIGDAANLADPMNGAGIHKAMESAYVASEVAVHALSSGDCSQQALSLYERSWNERTELDRRTGELFLSIVKNPNLGELYLFLLKALGRLAAADQRVRDLSSGIFSGVIPQRMCLSPPALLNVLPLDPKTWSSVLRAPDGSGLQSWLEVISSAARKSLKMSGRIAASPLENLDWGVEVLSKTLGLLGSYARDRVISSP